MRHRRLYGSPRGGADPHRRTAAPRVPRLRLGRASPSSTIRATCSSRSGPASWPTSRRPSPIARRTPRSASRTPAGRPTAGRTTSTPIPHQDCTGEITVIHNGIIENFRELRDGLEERGHTLTSETDTEAIAHLIEEAYKGDLADALRHALRQTEGAYAIVAMHRGEGDRLVGARHNVPLVVGLADGESFLASDVAAILAHTDQIVFLEDGDVADLRPWGVTITDVDGAAARTRCHDDRLVARGRREGRLRALHAQGDPRAARVARPGHHRPGEPGRPDRGRGTRRSRGRCCVRSRASSLSPAAAPTTRRSSEPRAIQDWTGLPARANVGSEFRYSPPPLDGTTLIIAVTQSGETADTIAPVRLARERGCPVIAVTNTVGIGHHPRGGRGAVPAGRARRSRSPRRRRS